MKYYLKKIVVAIITWEAKLVLKKYNPKIVAITGSVGKTSTKDAIFSVLSHFHFVRKSEKSFNSEIGVPLTILGCPNGWNDPVLWFKNILEGIALIVIPNHYPKWLVLEIGADRPGDIESITSWIKPDISVVTRLSKTPVHVEFFDSVEAVYREKAFLVRATKSDGFVILNSDDEDVFAFGETVSTNKIHYGTHTPADVVGTGYSIVYSTDDNKVPLGVSFDVSYKDQIAKFEILGGLGVQQMFPALAAISVGVSQDIPLSKMVKTLRDHHPSRGRMRILPGVKHTTIIDDSYNSSPVALHEALNTLDMIETSGRKIAVLGDMLELGTFSPESHKKAGEHVGKIASKLFTVGVRARGIAEGALSGGLSEKKIFQFEDSRIAGKELELILKKGDVVLIKGSQGVRMEKAVEEILENPEKKEELLVRQDKEWLDR